MYEFYSAGSLAQSTQMATCWLLLTVLTAGLARGPPQPGQLRLARAARREVSQDSQPGPNSRTLARRSTSLPNSKDSWWCLAARPDTILR